MRGVFSSRTCVPTLVVTLFHVFWEVGRDRIFLVSEPGLLKENLVLFGNLKQVILTL